MANDAVEVSDAYKVMQNCGTEWRPGLENRLKKLGFLFFFKSSLPQRPSFRFLKDFVYLLCIYNRNQVQFHHNLIVICDF